MKKLIIILLVVVCLASLWSCDNKNTNDQEPVETEPLSAYEQLNEDEKLIYEALIIAADDFYTPTSLRLLNVASMTSSYVYIKVQSGNRFGSLLTDTFMLGLSETSTLYEYTKGAATTIPVSVENWGINNINCEKINLAIDEYWDEKGLN